VGRFSLSSNEILLDSTEAVQSFLGPYWRRKIFCKGSVARFIEPLHLKWLPAKRQLRIKFNYATYNDQGELQTDGRQYLWWCGKDRTAIGHHRHRCRCCLLWSKEAVQGLHLCQKPSNQLRKDAAEPNHKSQHCQHPHLCLPQCRYGPYFYKLNHS
jgi:hypothetical protein